MKYIEICIGIVFIYLLLSLIATIVLELIAGFTAHRGRILKQRITEILDHQSDELSKAFFASPLYQQLQKAESALPSYISASRFWDIMFQHISKGVKGELTLDVFEAKVQENLPEGAFKETILLYIGKADGKMKNLLRDLNLWYEECMEGVSGWYKRRTQYFLLAIGLCIAILFNANTIRIYEVLNRDEKVRAEIVKMAEAVISNDTVFRKVNPIQIDDSIRLDSAMKVYQRKLDTLRLQYAASSNILGIGWDCDCPPDTCSWDKSLSKENKSRNNALFGCPTEKNQSPKLAEWFFLLSGWIITAMAISLGAPFWFDLLKLFVNIRNAGKVPEKKKQS